LDCYDRFSIFKVQPIKEKLESIGIAIMEMHDCQLDRSKNYPGVPFNIDQENTRHQIYMDEHKEINPVNYRVGNNKDFLHDLLYFEEFVESFNTIIRYGEDGRGFVRIGGEICRQFNVPSTFSRQGALASKFNQYMVDRGSGTFKEMDNFFKRINFGSTALKETGFEGAQRTAVIFVLHILYTTYSFLIGRVKDFHLLYHL
jgi:hypothetical protein